MQTNHKLPDFQNAQYHHRLANGVHLSPQERANHAKNAMDEYENQLKYFPLLDHADAHKESFLEVMNSYNEAFDTFTFFSLQHLVLELTKKSGSKEAAVEHILSLKKTFHTRTTEMNVLNSSITRQKASLEKLNNEMTYKNSLAYLTGLKTRTEETILKTENIIQALKNRIIENQPNNNAHQLQEKIKELKTHLAQTSFIEKFVKSEHTRQTEAELATQEAKLKDAMLALETLKSELAKHESILAADKADLKQLIEYIRTTTIEINNETIQLNNNLSRIKEIKQEIQVLDQYIQQLTFCNLFYEIDTEFGLIKTSISEYAETATLPREKSDLPLTTFPRMFFTFNSKQLAKLKTMLEEITPSIQQLANNENFSSLALLLENYKKIYQRHKLAFDQHSAQILLGESQAIANFIEPAKKVYEKLNNTYEKKIHLQVARLATFFKNTLKQIQRFWFKFDTFEEDGKTVYTLIGSGIKEIELLHTQLQSMQTTLNSFESHTKEKLSNSNISTLTKDVISLKNKYFAAKTSLDNAKPSIGTQLGTQEDLLLMARYCTSLLNNYLDFRNERYKFKDFFSGTDKRERTKYIHQLNQALQEYAYLNLTKTGLLRIIANGRRFTPGNFSITTNKNKNLQGILDTLEKMVDNPKIVRENFSHDQINKLAAMNNIIPSGIFA